MSKTKTQSTNEIRKKADHQPDVNRRITDGDYNRALAVKCINGTFVGRKTDGIVSFKGIPFVGKQPVGDLRWKAPARSFRMTASTRHIAMRKPPSRRRAIPLPNTARVRTACI